MREYREYSKDIWDYLGDMPYMPSRADRDRLLLSDNPERVQIWDFFFRIRSKDVGKPQKLEINEIEEEIPNEISKHIQKQQKIEDSIKEYKRVLFWKRLRNILYGSGCLILAGIIYKYILASNASVDWLLLCTSPFLFFGSILWLTVGIVGWNEKREIRDLIARSNLLRESHNNSIEEKVERKNYLKLEIKALKRQIPKPPDGLIIRKILYEHLDKVVDDSKIATGLLGKDLIEIDAKNPIPFSGPGELQNPERFPPTFTKFNAPDDINFDVKKHLTARRAFVRSDGSVDVFHGIYYLECILIAKDMLATYGLFYDFITGKSHAIEITEQYYDDVVAIVITYEFRRIKRGENEDGESKELYIEDAPTFTMSLKSGENRTVTFVNEKYFLELKDVIDISEEHISKIFIIERSETNANNAIRALRKQLRLHKKDDNIEQN